MLYVIETNLESLIGKDKEFSKGLFLEINSLEEMLKSSYFDFEDWSRVSFDSVKDYVNRL
jgi:antirestriction protein